MAGRVLGGDHLVFSWMFCPLRWAGTVMKWAQWPTAQ